MSAVEVLGFSRSGAFVASGSFQSSLVDAVACWCDCVQGRSPLTTALTHLAGGLGAKAVCVSRHFRRSDSPVRMMIYNVPSPARPRYEVTRSFVHCVLGRSADRPRPASVWFSSSADGLENPALKVFRSRARIAETVVVALAVEDKWVDYLEIHYALASNGTRALLNTLANTLSRTWLRRAPGLFSDATLKRKAATCWRLPEPVLGLGNPARLSRAEFRVCLLLSRGFSNLSVCSELSISPSTLKAHLRNIFAKTQVTSLADLLYLLLLPLDGEARQSGVVATRRA